ncbi:hypothetical protein [Winogradskyella sp.]|uniref:hypothetical protein n=1 Tax=Winogradskyella sp. TaxID=1883156 RepID=UPI00351183E9
MKLLKAFGHLIIILTLTIITQVGGLIWVITSIISRRKGWKKLYLFVIIYFSFNLVIIPPIASQFGRVQLPWFNDNLSPRNWFYPMAFRNYVNPELKNLLLESSRTSNIKITYLDANFPFFDGFLLLPHLSHDDGKKIDISFNYIEKDGTKTNKKPSVSGYGSYIKPESRTSKNCKNQGYWQYDFPKYLTFGIINDDLKLDSKSTSKLIKVLSSNSKTQKIFIEPHFKRSLGLENEGKIRFHGCQAVRHDDHIHLQIK